MVSAARKRFQPARRRRDELTSPFGGGRLAIDTSKVLSTLPIPVEADEGNAALLYIESSTHDPTAEAEGRTRVATVPHN